MGEMVNWNLQMGNLCMERICKNPESDGLLEYWNIIHRLLEYNTELLE